MNFKNLTSNLLLQEFYRYRCDLTKELIEDGLCQAVLIEGDLPDCFELHRYVTNQTQITLDEAMGSFMRFPAWMWRNKAMKDFLVWLRDYNLKQPSEKRTGTPHLIALSTRVSYSSNHRRW